MSEFTDGEAYMYHRVKEYVSKAVDAYQAGVRILNFIRKEDEKNERESRKHHTSKTV